VRVEKGISQAVHMDGSHRSAPSYLVTVNSCGKLGEIGFGAAA
jgi:hypothetical protein